MSLTGIVDKIKTGIVILNFLAIILVSIITYSISFGKTQNMTDNALIAHTLEIQNIKKDIIVLDLHRGSDHDTLIEIKNDVKWIKNSIKYPNDVGLK